MTTSTTEQQARERQQLAEDDPARRVQYLCEAAEYWHMSGADDRARELFERALVEDGHAAGDERVAYARFLLDVGDSARAHGLLDELWHSREVDGFGYHAAGELFEQDIGDLAAAMRWYTSGIVRLAGPDAAEGIESDVWIELLMGARRRVRRELGEPADEWDELWDAASRATADEDTAVAAQGPDFTSTPGRNDPCSCGSGHKYKKCCGAPGA